MGLKVLARGWHRKLGWLAGAALLLWASSGILHPMMSWLGPQTANFYPPTLSLQPKLLKQLPVLLAPKGELTGARLLKVVPSRRGGVLLVSRDRLEPPQYYSLQSGQLLVDFDRQQARWLAQHYSGLDDSEVVAVDRLDSFDDDYPAVNRLLPVYRVRYAEEDLRVYVHTETLALASISNRSKAIIQTLFQHLHTFKWLDATGIGRVLLIGLLMMTLFAFAATGLALVISFKHRAMANSSRRWHRRLSYLLWLPLLAWSASGFYHLLQSAYVVESTDLQLAEAIDISAPLDENFAWLSTLQGQALNSFSITADDSGKPLYRLSMAPEAGAVSREQRFSGRPLEREGRYIDAQTGLKLTLGDRHRATALARQFSGHEVADVVDARKLTRYDEGYDFRNKRLPVWQVTLAGDDKRFFFIDVASAILVDQSRSIDRYERWSFSKLHKWNFLTPLSGRFYRDIAIVITLLSLLFSAVLGVRLLMVRRRPKKSGA